MNKDQLEKAKLLSNRIELCKDEIRKAKYIQSENVIERKTYLQVCGLEENIEIPKSLFRVIGKLVLMEYQQELMELEKEFNAI